MPVWVIDTLKPKNGLDFPVVEAVDVAVEGYASLADAVTHFATQSAIDAINTALGTKANTSDVNTATASLQAQINQIEISASAEAVVAPEVAAARVAADGTSYQTLKERCDNTDNNVAGLNGDITNCGYGKKKIGYEWIYGFLDSSGEITTYPDNSRTCNKDYFRFDTDDTITLNAGFGAVLCEYNNDFTLHQRNLISSGTYPVSKDYLYRISIWDNVASTIQATPTQYAHEAWFTNSLKKEIDAANAANRTLSIEVSELKTDTFNDVTKFDVGKMKIGYQWKFGTLDSNGDIVPYGTNARSCNEDYFSFDEDTNIILNTGFGAILCEYNSDKTLHNRAILTSGKYPVSKNYLYRVCVWDNASSTIQETPTQYAYNIWYKPYTRSIVDDNSIDIINIKNDISSVALSTFSVTWELGNWNIETGEDSAHAKIARTTLQFTEDKEVEIAVNDNYMFMYGYFDLDENWHCDAEWHYIPHGNSVLRFVAKAGFLYKVKGSKIEPEDINDLELFSTHFHFKKMNYIQSDMIYTDISMFDDIAVCGDSYTAGSIFTTDTPAVLIGNNPKTRWGSVLQRITGAQVTTYASGGADTNTYQSRSDCLPQILSDNPHELYILCLGINDKTYVDLGTIDDIKNDYTQNPNTFYGNYGKIIAQIKEHAPNAKIIISKVFIVTLSNGIYYDYSSTAIEEIADKMGIPYVDTKDNEFFSSDFYNGNMHGGHPISVTYACMAKGMKTLLDRCIQDNTSYFADYYPN